MIINEWDSLFTQKYGHEFPRSYMTFDTEFTGSSESNDLIMEIGHVLVEDCQVTDELSVVLNWYMHSGVDASWLDYKLNNMRAIIREGWKLTPDYVKANGIDPIKALKFYHKMFQSWAERGLPFVAQNGQTADERMLRGNFGRYLRKSFKLPDNGYFDTGSIYKATQVWSSQKPDHVVHKVHMLPTRSDTLKTYFNRVIHAKIPGVKWNMDQILASFNLMEKHKVHPADRHSAGFDAKCLHWVMEEYRNTIRVQHGQTTQADKDLAYRKAKETYDAAEAKAKPTPKEVKKKGSPRSGPKSKRKKRTRPQRKV